VFAELEAPVEGMIRFWKRGPDLAPKAQQVLELFFLEL
jgi:hypothetical protein